MISAPWYSWPCLMFFFIFKGWFLWLIKYEKECMRLGYFIRVVCRNWNVVGDSKGEREKKKERNINWLKALAHAIIEAGMLKIPRVSQSPLWRTVYWQNFFLLRRGQSFCYIQAINWLDEPQPTLWKAMWFTQNAPI